MINWAEQCVFIPWTIKTAVFDSPNVFSTLDVYRKYAIDMCCHFVPAIWADLNTAMYHISIEQEVATWLPQIRLHASCLKDDRSVKAMLNDENDGTCAIPKTVKILHVFDIYGSFPPEITVFRINLKLFLLEEEKRTMAISLEMYIILYAQYVNCDMLMLISLIYILYYT